MEAPLPEETKVPEKVSLWKQFRVKTADWSITQWGAAAALVTFGISVIERLIPKKKG